MKKISIYGNERIDLLLNQHKFIIGTNYEAQYNMQQTIKNYTSI